MSESEQCQEAGAGRAPAGRPFSPSRPAHEDPADEPRPAPPPGVPLPLTEYDRLKEEAKERPPPDDAPAQED